MNQIFKDMYKKFIRQLSVNWNRMKLNSHTEHAYEIEIRARNVMN